MPGHAHHTTHKATLVPAQQGMEETCQHIPPGCFLCCPWLTHAKSSGKLPPQPGACLYRRGYSAEGNKGFAWRGQEERRGEQKQEMGHGLPQPTGHCFRDQHCNQPWDSDSWDSYCSDPSAGPWQAVSRPYSTSYSFPQTRPSSGISGKEGVEWADMRDEKGISDPSS